MCAKLRTVVASNNRDHPTRSLYYCLFAPRIDIFVLGVHIPFVVSHTINATPPERLQQHPLLFTTNHTDHTLFCVKAELNTTSTFWSQHHFVAIGNPERHVRKASHRGSKQQWRSPDEITLLLLVRTTHIYFCSSRTSRSWWITQSTQRHQRGCNNIPSFLQRTTPIARSFVWRLNSTQPPHPGHSTILLRSEIPSGMCAKLRTAAASNNRDHPTRSLYYCLFAPRIYIFVLRAHPVRGESHNQRNAAGEVATVPHIKTLYNSCHGQCSKLHCSGFISTAALIKVWLECRLTYFQFLAFTVALVKAHIVA